MNAALLLEHYARIADAPDAIARLRRFVLDLAVRGKLVEQDTGDEPASELLKRVEAGKAHLVRIGQIRKQKLYPVTSASEHPFQLPRNWEWAALGSLTLITQGFAFASGDFSKSSADGYPLIKIGDIGSDQPETYIKGSPDLSYLVRTGEILLGLSGSIKCAFWRGPAALLNQRIAKIAPVSDALQMAWLYLGVQACIDKWKAETSKLTVQNIKAEQLYTALVPVPPLAEQHRIVAKVDELMALCDQLDAARAERETARDTFALSTMARLNTPDPETFAADARFTLANLAPLTTRPDQIRQLRQTILNLAVRGMLVEQDAPQDLRPRLADVAAALPATWSYLPLERLLIEDTRNGYSRRPDDAPNGVPILRISAGTIRGDGLVAEEEHKLISGIDERARLQYGLRKGDLLACRFNGNKSFVGRMTLFDDYLGVRPIYPDKLIRVRCDRSIASPEFVRLASESDLVRNEIAGFCATTVGNWGISAGNLKQVRFPVPPIAEQHRIVAKVDALMMLCDQLEASLTTGEQTRSHLLEAVLHNALEPT